MRPLLAQLGFDGLTSIRLAIVNGNERALTLWSLAPSAWALRYRHRNYAAADPRVTLTEHRLSPVLWDAAEVDEDGATRRFLADAARYGVRSGFAVSFRDGANARVVVALDSSESPLSEVRRTSIGDRSGDLMLLCAALHERVLRPRCDAVAEAPLRRCGGLTARELECLRMAANGLTSGDIGRKLGIAERTVNFHMHNALRKLEALNRSEAIAKALTGGVLDSAFAVQRSV